MHMHHQLHYSCGIARSPWSEVQFVSALSKTERLDSKFEGLKLSWVNKTTAGVGNGQTVLQLVCAGDKP